MLSIRMPPRVGGIVFGCFRQGSSTRRLIRQRFRGARLVAFEGRVAAVGPVAKLNFLHGKIPVTASLKYSHEFEVQNRLERDSGFITLTLPLSVAAQ